MREPIARLAHELRTPISAIHTAADLLAQEQFGPIGSARYKGYAEDIRRSAAHALSVIEAMLDPDYLASGKHSMKPEQLDLTALISNTVAGIELLAEAQNIELKKSLITGLPHVKADKRTMKQILLNLLTNAIKFTPAGGRILVSTSHKPDGSVLIKIDDNGPGLSKHELRQLKKRINRDNAATGQPAEPTATGRGFGLPLAASLARNNGAKLKLSSARNGGFTVTVLIPRSRLLLN